MAGTAQHCKTHVMPSSCCHTWTWSAFMALQD
jgi:hypothetical protein